MFNFTIIKRPYKICTTPIEYYFNLKKELRPDLSHLKGKQFLFIWGGNNKRSDKEIKFRIICLAYLPDLFKSSILQVSRLRYIVYRLYPCDCDVKLVCERKIKRRLFMTIATFIVPFLYSLCNRVSSYDWAYL